MTSVIFLYVTKTRANLSRYSGKLGNCNGTINFEIDIMEKVFPNQFEIHIFATVNNQNDTFSLVQSADALSSVAL